jgi:hypothetical protein
MMSEEFVSAEIEGGSSSASSDMGRDSNRTANSVQHNVLSDYSHSVRLLLSQESQET